MPTVRVLDAALPAIDDAFARVLRAATEATASAAIRTIRAAETRRRLLLLIVKCIAASPSRCGYEVVWDRL
jgi:hypothetical protein